MLDEVARETLNSTEAMTWVPIEVTVDSGASDSVMPIKMCEGVEIAESPQSRGGVAYEIANVDTMPNMGERKCLVVTEESPKPKLMNFQVCDEHQQGV